MEIFNHSKFVIFIHMIWFHPIDKFHSHGSISYMWSSSNWILQIIHIIGS
jgi:hypothetical protein